MELKYKLAQNLLPSQGFFGEGKLLKLVLLINDYIDLVQIKVQSGFSNYLNLSYINLLDFEGEQIDLKDICSSASLSSSFTKFHDLNVLDQLVNKQAIHSGLEQTPILTLKLNKPVKVGKIEIGNRSGINGERSRNLVVTAMRSETEIFNYINSDQNSLIKMLDKLLSTIGYPTEFDLAGENQVDLLSSELQNSIAARIKNGDLQLDLAQALALLPLYINEPIINENVLVFMGVVIAKLIGKDKQIPTGDLKEFQHILNSPQRIEKASKYAAHLLKNLQEHKEGFVVAKHKIGFSDLLARKEEYKRVMHIVCNQLSKWSLESVICYGTLLGAVRDKGFIPHDDDIDILYFDSSRTHEEMMQNRSLVLEKFKAHGYQVWDSGTNFQVIPKGYSVGIDLFPCWTDGEFTSLMMEKYLYRSIPTNILKPIGSIELYGEIYPAPNNSELFLQERYGERWHISNPYFEWPWTLDNIESWPRRSPTRILKAKRSLVIAWGQYVSSETNTLPKNSSSLIKSALLQNYDGIEIDVRLSADKIFVLGHDDVITNSDGAKIRISDTSAEELGEFPLGKYNGEQNTILSLTEALKLIGDKIVHLDPRIPSEEIANLRRVIDEIGFNAGKIIFCGYGDLAIKELNIHFPESVILYKYYGSHCNIDNFVLDELNKKQVDGLMLYWPLHYEDISDFMNRLKQRNLQILFYVHGSWPSRGETDESEVSLQKMIDNNVDYITTTASNISPFKGLVKESF